MDTTEEPSLVNKAPPIYSTHLNIIIIFSSRIPLHVRQPAAAEPAPELPYRHQSSAGRVPWIGWPRQ